MNIPMGDSDYALSAMYSASTEEDRAYTRRRIDSYLEGMTGAVRERAASFISGISDMVRDVATSRKTHAIRSRLRYGWMSDDVRMLLDIGAVQNAKSLMQGYISGMPCVDKAVRAGRIRLYNEAARSLVPTKDIRHNPYYREAKHSMLKQDDKGWGVEEFVHTREKDQEPLCEYQRMVIKAVEDNLEDLLASSKTDPTDPWNRLMD